MEGSLKDGRVAVSRTESGYFLSSEVCNILLHLQLYISCFARAEITNVFWNSNNMFQSTSGTPAEHHGH